MSFSKGAYFDDAIGDLTSRMIIMSRELHFTTSYTDVLNSDKEGI